MQKFWNARVLHCPTAPRTSGKTENCRYPLPERIEICRESKKYSFLMKIKSHCTFTRRIQSLSSGAIGKIWIQIIKTRSLTAIHIFKSYLVFLDLVFEAPSVPWMGRGGRAMLSTQKPLQVINKICQQEFNFSLAVKHFNSQSTTQLKFNFNGKIIFLTL